MDRVPWYDKPLWAIVALLLFFPLGYYALFKNTRWSKNTKLLIGGGYAALLAVGLMTPAPPEPPPPSPAELARADSLEAVRVAERAAARADEWKAEDDRLEAYTFVRRQVRNALKAPSTAEFPGVFDGMQDHVAPLGDQRYLIDSYVDSQNAFGAMLRTRWTAEVQQVAEGDWRVVSLEFAQ